MSAAHGGGRTPGKGRWGPGGSGGDWEGCPEGLWGDGESPEWGVREGFGGPGWNWGGLGGRMVGGRPRCGRNGGAGEGRPPVRGDLGVEQGSGLGWHVWFGGFRCGFGGGSGVIWVVRCVEGQFWGDLRCDLGVPGVGLGSQVSIYKFWGLSSGLFGFRCVLGVQVCLEGLMGFWPLRVFWGVRCV